MTPVAVAVGVSPAKASKTQPTRLSLQRNRSLPDRFESRTGSFITDQAQIIGVFVFR
jgi:hypothetical protein